ncbi:LamG domain-containing protein [Pyxidicoccus trucidator]|uniref:LamG domain-containing protein n=1 Tax=Pyxidicoccus trucidator TaxID=2709662 RepID=UPI001F08810C|nr:LamG domain-containing protein [Pyxidicoccus trucidator]
MKTMSDFSSRASRQHEGWGALRRATKVSAVLAGVLGLVGCSPEQAVEAEPETARGASLGLTQSGSGLLHRYSFDTDGRDSVSGANGALLGGASVVVNGEVTLNGGGGYVSLPIGGTIASLQDATFEAWVKWDSAVGQTWARIFDFNDGVWNKTLFLTPMNGRFDSGPATGTPRFSITTTAMGGEQQATSASGFPVGVLAHVAVTLDSVTGLTRLYVNGGLVAEKASTTLTPASLGTPVNSWLGRSLHPADPFFKGTFSEFRVYGAALSPTRITDSYNAGPDAAMAPSEAYVVTDGRLDVAGVAADTTSVYWVENRPSGLVMKASLSTGSAQVLASGRSHPIAVATDGLYVYWAEAGGSIFKLPVNGGAITLMASGLPAPESLVTDGAFLYFQLRWQQGINGWIYRMPVQGGTPTSLLAEELVGPMTVDGGHLYWMAPGGYIVKALKTGGPTASLWNASLSTTGLASDGQHLYIAENTSPYDILQLPVGGGQWAPAVVVRWGSITRLAVGPSRVVWADSSLGAIMAKGK